LFGKRMLLNYRSGEAEDHLSRSRLARRLVRAWDLVIVPSGYLVGIFRQVGLTASAIPNIVDTRLFSFRSRAPLRPVFLSNRNLEPLYNVECTLRAFAMIREVYPDARLDVVGDGSQAGHLRHVASRLGLAGVTFHGKVAPQHMPEFYGRADIYLNSSEIDNMPTSLLEAQACGLPVVTSRAGGIPHIVRHEETGLLVPPNDPRALADAALRVLAEPVLASRMTEQARRHIAASLTGQQGPNVEVA
jgi:phenylacetate-CoA ligase